MITNKTKTKKERFEEVAAARTNKILEMIRLLKNCANTGNYEYTEEQYEKIFAAIDEALADCKSAYKSGKKEKKKDIFKL